MKEYAKVFESGNSQAVRLPKKYRTKEKEFIIRKAGSSIILTPKENQWEMLDQALEEFSEEFLSQGRNQPDEQIREEL